MWTNLTPPEVIQWAYELIRRSPTCLVDDILNLRCHSHAICHDEWPSLVVVNRVSLPQVDLPTPLSFPHSHAFRNGGPWMIWDSHSSSMEKPNANDRGWAMGFCIGTIVVQGNSKRVHIQISRQVMDLNYLTWIFNLFLAKHLCFGQSHPPTPPHLPLVAPFVGSIMAV